MLDLAPVAPREHRRAQPRDERRLMRVTSGRRWRAMGERPRLEMSAVQKF